MTIVEVYIGLKRPATLLIEIMYQELMLTLEVYIGIIPAIIPTITQVAVVHCQVYNFLRVLLKACLW